jgi:hypothetical protein
MNTPSLTDSSKELQVLVAAQAATAEDRWFDEPPSRTRSSAPPVVSVGEFLGDPEVDAWLR